MSIFRIRWEVIQQKALLACIKKILGLKGLSALGRIGAKLGAIKSSLEKVKLSNISYTANAF